MAIIVAVGYFLIPSFLLQTYSSGSVNQALKILATSTPFVVTHVATPVPVKGIYMTSCVVGSKSLREGLKKIANETDVNSIVIDIKDFSGKISFETDNPKLKGAISERCLARDMKEFVGELHQAGIYVIGRITVFQDPYYTAIRPDLAIKKSSDHEAVWKDFKGLSFIEAGAKDFWSYIAELSVESYKIGFDELNYDYIRFPSDGNMKDIYYPFSEETVKADPELGMAKVLKSFFAFLSGEVRSKTKAKISADLFGMTTTNPDDLNIGQLLEYTLPYFDYVSPMVYPSHYPKDFNGWLDPNKHPYGVVKYSMDKAVVRVKLFNDTVASTSVDVLRPWLQDFNYGGTYGVPEVQAQMSATYDSGLDSWLLWSPSNRYTIKALGPIASTTPKD